MDTSEDANRELGVGQGRQLRNGNRDGRSRAGSLSTRRCSWVLPTTPLAAARVAGPRPRGSTPQASMGARSHFEWHAPASYAMMELPSTSVQNLMRGGAA